MLALCWLIFRSWATFFRSWPPLARLLAVFCSCWSFFSRFGSLRVGSWCAQGQFLRVQNLIFRCFVARAGLQCASIVDEQNPQFFLGFCMVFTYRKRCAQGAIYSKIIPGGCRTKLPAKNVLKTFLGVDSGKVWCSLGRHLASFCALLGDSWPLLGASGASLGHFLGALGRLLAALGRFGAAFWRPGPSQASILKNLGTPRTGF